MKTMSRSAPGSMRSTPSVDSRSRSEPLVTTPLRRVRTRRTRSRVPEGAGARGIVSRTG